MRPSQVIERVREKVEEVTEKTGEVIGNGLRMGWGKVKGVKKARLRGHRKTEGNKMSEKKTGFRRISDEAVKAKTGKGWEEWFKILDARVEQLREHHGLSPWWAQTVTIRYERERGLRK